MWAAYASRRCFLPETGTIVYCTLSFLNNDCKIFAAQSESTSSDTRSNTLYTKYHGER